MQDHALVSLVGMSPGALLAPLLAWKVHASGSLKRVLLVAPGEPAGRAARSIKAEWNDPQDPAITIREVDREELLAGRIPILPELDRIAGGLRFQYLASPGLNTAVAKMYSALAVSGRLDDVLYSEPGGPLWSLLREDAAAPVCSVENVGLARLCRMLGLKARLADVDNGVTEDVRDALGDAAEFLSGADLSPGRLILTGDLEVDWVAERSGVLLLLVLLRADNKAASDAAKRRLHRLVELVRQYDRAQLNLLAVATGNQWGGTMHAADVTVVHAAEAQKSRTRGVRRWLQAPNRGRQPPTHTLVAFNGIPGNGAGQRGETLALFLGPDPSATLVSLYTHRPGRAVVLYDQSSPSVGQRAAGLWTMASLLPVDELILVPSDRWGRGAGAVLDTLNVSLIDITPGSKAQTVALLRAVGKMVTPPLVWTLAAGKGLALCLDGVDDPLTMVGPPVSVLAGVLHAAPPVVVPPGAGERVLDAAAQIMRAYVQGQAARHPENDIRLPHWNRRISGRRMAIVRLENWSYQVATGDTTTELIPGSPDADDWGRLFELVVTHRLSQSGVFDEVIGNIQQPRELDTVARLGFHVFVFESGSGRIDDAKIAKHVDKASVQLGRFAVPVVVAPRFGEESAELRRRHPSCIFWSLATLESKRLLQTAVQQALEGRRWVAGPDVEDAEGAPEVEDEPAPS